MDVSFLRECRMELVSIVQKEATYSNSKGYELLTRDFDLRKDGIAQ